jgi:hypothetical protein
MVSLNITKQRLLALAGAAALTLSVAGTTMAAGPVTGTADVTTTVDAGVQSVSVAVKSGTALPNFTHQGTDASASTTLTVTATDFTSSGNPYTVTIQSSDFVGANNTITGDNFTISSISAATAVDSENPGTAPATNVDVVAGTALNSGTAPVEVNVFNAAAGQGDGAWSADVVATLNVPAYTPADEYKGTVTVTMSPVVGG